MNEYMDSVLAMPFEPRGRTGHDNNCNSYRVRDFCGRFTFSSKIDAHLQALMDRNTEGQLSASECEELEALVGAKRNHFAVTRQALRVLDGLYMSLTRADLRQFVESWPARCEYCRMHQSLQGPPSTSNILCRSPWGAQTIWTI